MTNLGGNHFVGIQFPVVIGERFLHLDVDPFTGTTLVDVYRWDREDRRLIVEMFQGRALPGAPPLTVTPLPGAAGGVRLGAAPGGELVGYLSGGRDPRSVSITSKEITVREGDRPIVRLDSNSFFGSAIGVWIKDDGVALGASIPAGFPQRRTFVRSPIFLPDLVRMMPPQPGLARYIVNTDFEGCLILGPALIGGPLMMIRCTFPRAPFLWGTA